MRSSIPQVADDTTVLAQNSIKTKPEIMEFVPGVVRAEFSISWQVIPLWSAHSWISGKVNFCPCGTTWRSHQIRNDNGTLGTKSRFCRVSS